MREHTRRDLAARALLTVAALLPYWRLLSFSVIFVSDDYFTSDIFNGELPGRLLVAQMLRSGQWPLWTSQLCSGYPLAGAPSDPIGLALFTLLPAAPALDALILVILLVAAHGAYSLARRLGADRIGAVLAGLAFAGSGYIASQLKHLSIMSTIAWLPVGLVLIDRVFDQSSGGGSRGRRPLLIATLGLVYGNQVLAGFPQSAYICGLVYGSFALFRAWSERGKLAWLRWLVAIAGALVLGAAAGAVVLVPLAELTRLSDRVAPLDYHWAAFTNLWPRNLWTFFIPYINGDASNGTYIGPPPFWENYGYVGAATTVLAIYAAVREWRRARVAFMIVMTVISVAFILGPHTPIYYVAFQLIPGMSGFRAPTRFMVLVDLGLALLAAVGLTRFRADLERWWPAPPPSRLAPPVLIAAGLCAATALDLFIHQPRQNPMVSARDWLAPPRTAAVIRDETSAPRTFTPRYRDIHRRVHESNPGWTRVEPYYKLRDLLEPDIGGGYWNVPSADCYVGLAPRWYVTVWSYHYFEDSFIYGSAFPELHGARLSMKPGFVKMLRTYGVTHVISPYPGREPGLTQVDRGPEAYVYKVEGTARVRVVRAARRVLSEAHAVRRLQEESFDPDREILLLGAPDSVHPSVEDTATEADQGDATSASARITHEDGRTLLVEAVTPRDAFLLLADSYYPGWRAEVDGLATPIYRANISVRGIALPKGQHTVRFTYDAPRYFRGLGITVTALTALVGWFGAAAWRQYA